MSNLTQDTVKPNADRQVPPSMDQENSTPVSIRSMLEAGVHFGHQTTRWNPKMKPFIFGARNGIHILDLQQTLDQFNKAYNHVLRTVAAGHSVLFVGTKKQAMDVIREEADRCGMYYVNSRWLGGTLTNFRTVKQSIERLREIENMATDGTFEKLTKKEVLSLTRQQEKLEKNLGGIKNMNSLPGVVFIVDPRKERIAVSEANKLEIPVVAITDTNCDPDAVTFPIPGNDDAIRSVRLFTSKIADACMLGKKMAQERAVISSREQQAAANDAAAEAAAAERGTMTEEELAAVAPRPTGPGPKVEMVSHRLPRRGDAPSLVRVKDLDDE